MNIVLSLYQVVGKSKWLIMLKIDDVLCVEHQIFVEPPITRQNLQKIGVQKIFAPHLTIRNLCNIPIE